MTDCTTCPECGQPEKLHRVVTFICHLCSEVHDSISNTQLFPFPPDMKTERGPNGFYACCKQCPDKHSLEALAESEVALFQNWTRDHTLTCHPEDLTPERWSLFGSGTGLGVEFNVFCRHCRVRHNVTDYHLW